MGNEIKNNPEKTKEIAKKIGDLSNTSISRANGTSEVSDDGLTAKYNDTFLDFLDENLIVSFQAVMNNSKTKFNQISDDFEKADQNASV